MTTSKMTNQSWEERFEEAYVSFQLCDIVKKDDYDRLKSFFRQEIHQAKAEMLEDIIDEFDGWGDYTASRVLEETIKAKYPDLISTAGDGVTKTP